MKLFFRKFGEGSPFIILHGLYGSSDNWVTIGRTLSQHFEVWLPDIRNHGRSPHSPEHHYDIMASDLAEFMDEHKISKAVLMGHSMGGKVAMNFANRFPERLSHLIVVDISPKSYLFTLDLNSESLNHLKILNAMANFNFSGFSSREEIEMKLSETIKSLQIRQFLLKNVKRNDQNRFGWVLNVEALLANLNNILDGFKGNAQSIGEPIIGFPVLFVKGANSDYITRDDEDLIKKIFPYSELVTIENSGHWLHAEQPELLIKALLRFFDLD